MPMHEKSCSLFKQFSNLNSLNQSISTFYIKFINLRSIEIPMIGIISYASTRLIVGQENDLSPGSINISLLKFFNNSCLLLDILI